MRNSCRVKTSTLKFLKENNHIDKIGTLKIHNTRDLVNAETRMCHLIISDGKVGKTTLTASLNDLTKKLYNKKTLYIATEPGDGGGTASIEDFGVDYVIPTNKTEYDGVVAALRGDNEYAGVVLDSSTELVARIIKPYALKFPSREKVAVREMGVADRGDYQSMGEFMRQSLNALINLTSPAYMSTAFPKHLVVTARLREKYNDSGNVIGFGPDLPGQMATNAVGMFQTVSKIEVKAKVIPNPDKPGSTMRVDRRVLRTVQDPAGALGDRYRILPEEFDLTGPNGKPVGYPEIWEQFWLPRINSKGETK